MSALSMRKGRKAVAQARGAARINRREWGFRRSDADAGVDLVLELIGCTAALKADRENIVANFPRDPESLNALSEFVDILDEIGSAIYEKAENEAAGD